MSVRLSIIIPALNEAATIKETLDAIRAIRENPEIIVVDGGSTDKTIEIVENYPRNKTLRLIKFTEANRGRQLHEGTRHAAGEIFWFLHADTRPVQGCGKQIKQYMRYGEIVGGNFRIIFDGTSRWARFLTWLYPQLRSINLVYGDSAMLCDAKLTRNSEASNHCRFSRTLICIGGC